ncbi:MAG: hypothetical protein AABX10_05360 [Nanoarchaeota archaeon]
MQKRVWFTAIFIALAIIAILFLNHEPSYNQDGLSQNEEANYDRSLIQNSPQQKDNEEDCQVKFSEYLIDPKYVQKIGQVGVVHGGGKSIVERSYISIKEEFYEQQIPLYSPTDMTLFMGAHYKIPGSPDNTLSDYVIKFDAGCGVEILLGHVKGVVDSIGSQLTQLKADSREDMLSPVDFKAGELIGYYIQQREQGAVAGFDFVVRDLSVVNQFINQERYSDDRARNLINGVCPYDYYTDEKKEAYYNLLGGAGGRIFEVKDCGSASRDKAGAISGMWFLNKEITGTIYEDYKEGDYGSPLSIMGDEEAVSIGNIGLTSPIYRIYTDNPTYKLPSQVTDEKCYQFSSSGGYAYFKLIDASTMDVYYSSSGNCPEAIPQGGKRYYK